MEGSRARRPSRKRALVTPDEIGQLFARVDDRGSGAYPGLALAVISGAPPVALRRVNYYEDFQFMGLFDPNPDYPFSGPKELCIEGRQLGLSWVDYGLSLGAWSVTQGQLAAVGAEAATVLAFNGLKAAVIRVPRGGMIGPVPGDLQARLFSVLYYGDGDAAMDPFAEVREFCRKVKGRVADKRRRDRSTRNVIPSRRRGDFVFAVLAEVVVAAGDDCPALGRLAILILALAVFAGIAVWKKAALSGINAELVKYGVGPAPAPVVVKSAPVIAPPTVQPVIAPRAGGPGASRSETTGGGERGTGACG